MATPEYIDSTEKVIAHPDRARRLKDGDGGGTFDGMLDMMDAKIAAAEARTDTKFAELLGEIKALEKSTAGTKTTVIFTGIAAVTLVVAIFGWGSSMFGVGMNAQSIADRSAENVLTQAAPKLDALQTQYTDLNSKVDTVIEYLKAQKNGDKSRTLPEPEIQLKTP